jgi:hypothetical protein
LITYFINSNVGVRIIGNTGGTMTRCEAQARYAAWRKWERIWSWTNILLGGASVGLGALVAANIKNPLLIDQPWPIACAVAAPVLTFVLTTLKPQAEAAAFKGAARELEKALAIDEDPSVAVVRGIDILNGAK